jgi:hypothetical protein
MAPIIKAISAHGYPQQVIVALILYASDSARAHRPFFHATARAALVNPG